MNILVTGAKGMLGSAICDVLSEKHTIMAMGHKEFDVTDPYAWESIRSFTTKPDLIIHCAAFTQVDAAENQPSTDLWNTNVDSIHHLCNICTSLNIRVVYPQTFLVLKDQSEQHPSHSEAIEPLGWYAKSKWEAEKILRERLPSDKRLIIRLAGFYGGGPLVDKNFVGLFLKRILPQALQKGEKEILVGDRIWQPTWTKDIANTILWCLDNQRQEIYQYATNDFASFADLAKAILNILAIKDIEICKVSSKDIPVVAPRPQEIIMQSSEELVQANFVHPYYKRLQKYLTEFWPNYIPSDYLTGSKS